MEYSTNDAENFTRAANGNTNVRFAVGDKVWIRERNNPNNIRYLHEVGQEEFTEDELEKKLILISVKGKYMWILMQFLQLKT